MERKVKAAIVMEYINVLNILIVRAPQEKTREKVDPMNFERMEKHMRTLNIECSEHNDNYTLDDSLIEDKMRELQEDDDYFFKIFGDSAYSDNDVLGTGGGRGMASVRECVEWSYKDLKSQWKYLDYRHVLQLRSQPIGKIVFVCMLLRNAYVTMYGSQTTEYFLLLPPTFENWLEQGPRAHIIPNNSIFSPNYVPPVHLQDF